MKNTRLIGILALIALVLMVFSACEGTVEEKEVPYPADRFAALVTYGGASHCGLAFVWDGTFNEAFIPNEWAKLSNDGTNTTLSDATTGDFTEFTADYRVLVQGGSSRPGSYYPKFIVITLGGTSTLYEGQQIVLNTTTGEYTSGSGTSPIRYFKVSSLTTDGSGTITSTATISLANSFEGSLNVKDKAKKYIETLRKFETTGTANVDTSSFVKYVKTFPNNAASLSAALAGATLLNTERLGFGARGTASVTATPTAGKIAVGAGKAGISSVGAGAWTDNNNWAYASTFFKRNSSYSGHFNFTVSTTPAAGDAVGTSLDNSAKSLYIVMQERLAPIAAKLVAAGKFESDVKAGTKNGSDILLIEGAADVVTGATAYNTAAYTKLFMLAK